MRDKEIESKLIYGIYDAETSEYKELGSIETIPRFAKGGIVPPGDSFIGVDLAEEPGETIILIKFKRKHAKRLIRNFKRAMTGLNNRRKMHGLPMYRHY